MVLISGSLAPLLYTEPVKLLYGSSAVSSAVLWQHYHIQNLLSSCMVLQWFFGTAIIQNLLSSCMVLQAAVLRWLFGWG